MLLERKNFSVTVVTNNGQQTIVKYWAKNAAFISTLLNLYTDIKEVRSITEV